MQDTQILRWSTNDVAQKERFDYWRDWICGAFDPMSPELRRLGRAEFRGEISVLPLGEAALMEIGASFHSTGRSLQDIARGSRDYVFLYRQLSDAWFDFDYQEGFLCRSGSLVFGDADRPFLTGPSGESDFHHYVLKLPRRMLSPVLVNPRDVNTRIVSGQTGLGALLLSYFDSFVTQAPHLTPQDHYAALQALVSLTAVACNRAASDHDPRQAVRMAQLQQAKRMIEHHLTRADLAPATVAQLLGMSVRLLHKLFEPAGITVSRYIVARRLELARSALARADGRRILEIALSCGFESLATFYRAFKQAHGVAPADYRENLITAAEHARGENTSSTG
jgi:AraC-like DNA-binding protein